VNKTRLIERIAEIANNKIIEGVTDLRDESSRKGIKVVIELKKDANAKLNTLFGNLQTMWHSKVLK
jgi:DNA gyrase subunit A